MEHELGDIGQDGSVAGRDTVLGSGGEEFAENEVDVGGGHETAAQGGRKFGAKTLGFEDLHLVAGVEEAEGGMSVVAEHAAAASVRSLEVTAVGLGILRDGLLIVCCGRFLGHFHGILRIEVTK